MPLPVEDDRGGDDHRPVAPDVDPVEGVTSRSCRGARPGVTAPRRVRPAFQARQPVGVRHRLDGSACSQIRTPKYVSAAAAARPALDERVVAPLMESGCSGRMHRASALALAVGNSVALYPVAEEHRRHLASLAASGAHRCIRSGPEQRHVLLVPAHAVMLVTRSAVEHVEDDSLYARDPPSCARGRRRRRRVCLRIKPRGIVPPFVSPGWLRSAMSTSA